MADVELGTPVNFGSAANPIDIGAADMPTLQIATFNTDLGTLDSVLITLVANNTLESLAVNLGKATSYQNLSASATVTISGPDGVTTSTPLSVGPTSGSIAAGSFSKPVTITPASVSQSTTTQFSPTDLATYETSGNGTLDFLLKAALTDVSNPSSGIALLNFGYDAFSHGSVEVDYDYTPLAAVPEPGTMMAGLFALGFGFIAVCRSRARYQ
jgi:hypothetical protein